MCRYNSQQDTRLFRSTWVTLCLCLFSVTLQATPRTADDDAWNANRRLETVASGLIISLPVIDQQALVHEVHTLNQQLTQRQENLSNQIEQNRFTAAGPHCRRHARRSHLRRNKKTTDTAGGKRAGPDHQPTANPGGVSSRQYATVVTWNAGRHIIFPDYPSDSAIGRENSGRERTQMNVNP